MDEYALKRAFREAPEQRDMVRFVRDFPEAFLDLENLRGYRPLEPANPRLRELLGRTLDRGMWRLLWIPPSLHNYQPSGPFAAAELGNVTKQLVFSAWHMVPRAVASLVSYEAERRMMRAGQPRGRLTQDDWKKQRGLLRFGMSSGRLTGMPLLLLVYPCLTFARDYDPRDASREGLLTANELRARFEERLRAAVGRLGIAHESDGPVDERWYWLTPILLDFAEFPAAAKAWWSRADLARLWAGVEVGEEDAGWTNHIEQAKQVIEDLQNGTDRLGLPPDDLFEDLALAASAAPATAALRTYARASRSDPARLLPLRLAAARTGRAFLTLFNHAEVTEAVRSEFTGEPYWERVLEYSHAGGLQSVLDEYAHLLRESLGLAAAPATQCVDQIASEVIAALTIRAASL